MLEEFLDRVAALFDLAHGVAKLAVAEEDRSLGARVHHQDVGTKLLEAPDQILAIGVFGDKVEEVEVALRVANDAARNR